MNLFLHLFIHIALSLLAGFIVWKLWQKPVASFVAGIVGGFLVDLDHVIDYFLAFGWNIRLDYFAKGYQFLKSDKIYVLLHGWEYVIILAVLAIWVLKNKTAKSVILALALGLFFHLGFDASANEGAKFSTYSIANRMHKNFELKDLVTPEHYLDHQARKKLINFE
ncbi:MAG: hypothetical protein WC238_02465 [Parcubacteria group bacterium]|jgi:hypothetical protein